jgi:3-deoxy-D-manno-octulosonate 8-phosphate phosphatase (KDO 8-P phosphatase)
MPSWLIDTREGEARARAIDWLVLDVDGVLTDGMLYTGATGVEWQAFHVHDGHGIRMWQWAGKHAAVISGRISKAAATRCSDLGIAHVYQGAGDKSAAFRSLLDASGTSASRVCYCGDEILDIGLFRTVGLAVAVADAVPEAVAAAHMVTMRPGGRGAVREIVDYLLKAQGCWEQASQRVFDSGSNNGSNVTGSIQ